ncbi:MAG TPA: gephyrin-like molybdotransferase Glp [Methylovirgula sp.]|nr:gephyrin-like molybdotransferase Glp [Methylovirgula sp.]
MISVNDARAQILSAAHPRESENVPLAEALGRTLAESLRARRTQPSVAISAMDGYALHAADLAAPGRLHLIGTSAAGHGFEGAIGPGETVRIFTGAPVPEGADAVLMQEDADIEADFVLPLHKDIEPGRNIRRAGIDFTEGATLLSAGTRLGPIETALAAAMNYPELPVTRRPRVAILATGDELVPPGGAAGPGQIVASNAPAVAAYVELAGGLPIDLGIAGDNFAALEAGISAARENKADVLVTLGGASVGDHDLVKSALAEEGMELGFWRIAMRPGKPLIHGRLGDMLILGLPGNPAASIVCSLLFLVPLIRALCGDPRAGEDRSEPALLGMALRANGPREDYVRSSLVQRDDGLPVATPFRQQDSSLLSVFSKAQCLLIRPAQAPAAREGDLCRVIRLRHFLA